MLYAIWSLDTGLLLYCHCIAIKMHLTVMDVKQSLSSGVLKQWLVTRCRMNWKNITLSGLQLLDYNNDLDVHDSVG